MSQIYLISPPKIILKAFSKSLEKALSTNLVPLFQLRLKDYENSEVKKIALEIKKICHQNNCKFILNDFDEMALEIDADGVHVGADDADIAKVRKQSPQNFIIGASCYDSKTLALSAIEKGATDISFGAFFPSKTKKSRGNPTFEILEWAKKNTNVPITAIGGITAENCRDLVLAKADYLAVISYVWDHPKGEDVAIKNIIESI